jgi:hypothetical protein
MLLGAQLRRRMGTGRVGLCAATAIRDFETQFVPGPFQTEDCTRRHQARPPDRPRPPGITRKVAR